MRGDLIQGCSLARVELKHPCNEILGIEVLGFNLFVIILDLVDVVVRVLEVLIGSLEGRSSNKKGVEDDAE